MLLAIIRASCPYNMIPKSKVESEEDFVDVDRAHSTIIKVLPIMFVNME